MKITKRTYIIDNENIRFIGSNIFSLFITGTKSLYHSKGQTIKVLHVVIDDTPHKKSKILRTDFRLYKVDEQGNNDQQHYATYNALVNAREKLHDHDCDIENPELTLSTTILSAQHEWSPNNKEFLSIHNYLQKTAQIRDAKK